MSTFIFNLNDTTALGDSVVAKVAKLSEVCQPIVTETETNAYDWYIVATICGAVIIVALTACYAVLSWKEKEIQADKDERDYKMSKEKTDIIRKQKSDLLDKYLDFLKEQTKGISLNKNEDQTSENIIQTIKNCLSSEKQQTADIDKSTINQYRQVLEYLIQLSQKDELDKISEDTFNSIFNTPTK